MCVAAKGSASYTWKTRARAALALTPRPSLSRADYDYNKLPDAKERAALGQAVGLSARAVQVWFQNRRQRQKPSGTSSSPPAVAPPPPPPPPAQPTWVEMEASKRLLSSASSIGPTPTQLEAMSVGGPPPSSAAFNKAEAADAIVAEIQRQAAALSYAMPDPVQIEHERALQTAVAHAKALSSDAPSSLPSSGIPQAAETPPQSLALGMGYPTPPINSAPSGVLPPAGGLPQSNGALLPPPQNAADGLQRPAGLGSDAAALARTLAAAQAQAQAQIAASRLNPSLLLSLDHQSQQLELRAALLDAYAKNGVVSGLTPGAGSSQGLPNASQLANTASGLAGAGAQLPGASQLRYPLPDYGGQGGVVADLHASGLQRLLMQNAMQTSGQPQPQPVPTQPQWA